MTGWIVAAVLAAVCVAQRVVLERAGCEAERLASTSERIACRAEELARRAEERA